MDAATRRRLTSRTRVGSGNECWQTPPAIFRDLTSRFGPFDVDLCADSRNHLLPVWIGPGAGVGPVTDALQTNWSHYGHAGFCNPVYDTPFMRRMFRHARTLALETAFRTVFLVPFRLSVVKVAYFELGAAIWVCDRRITFYEHGAPRFDAKGRPMPSVFDSCLVLFERKGLRAPASALGLYQVPEHVYAD